MKKTVLLVLSIFLFTPICLMAQIGVPVNLQTGQPMINIPVYEIKNGVVSIPISLYYSPGVKVAQPYGNDEYNIGAGWAVSAGGKITRSVKSLPDDYQGTGVDTRMGWLYGTGANDIATFTPQSRTNCTGDATNYGALNSFASNNTDTEPDVFSFNFGGYSGQFMFDNNKVIQTLPYQDLNIQPAYSASGAISAFTITTNNGVQYTFMPTTTITMSVAPADAINNVLYLRDKLIKYAQSVTYTVVWGLQSINSPSGSSLSLTYGGQDPVTGTHLEVVDTIYTNAPSTDIYLADNTSSGVYKKILFYTKTISDTKLLSSISEPVVYYPGTSSGNEHVVLRYGASSLYIAGVNSGPIQILQNALALTGFDVYVSNDFIKTISLNTVTAGKYYFLQSVHEFANNCTVTPPYEFEYLGTTLLDAPSTILPLPQGSYPDYVQGGLDYCQQDYWGYYNGNKATSLVPNLYMYPNEPLQERFRLQQIPGYSGTYIFLAGGADRTVNSNAITAGSLYRIVFPTGGSVKIDYESNQYVDARTSQTFLGGGIRAKTVTLHDGINTANDIVKNYAYTGGVLLNRPQFAFSIPVYTDYSGAVHSIEEYTDQATQARYFTARSIYDLNPYDFDYPNVMYQSGAESQTGKGKTVYQYLNPATFAQTSSPEYGSPDQWNATFSQYATTSNPSSGACMTKGLMSDGYYSFPYPTNTNYNFERGLLQNIQAFNEAGQLVKRIDYQYTPIYKNTSPVNIYGVTYDYFTYSSSDVNTKAFAYGKYRLFAAMNKYQANSTETIFDPGTNFTKSASVETDNFYNSPNHRMLSSTQTTASNDGVNFTTYKTQYKYPQDYPVVTTTDPPMVAISALKSSNINNTVIEKILSITKPGQTEKVTGAELVQYHLFSIPYPQNPQLSTAGSANRILPTQTLSLKTNVPLGDFVESSVDGYNNFKHDLRYQVTRNMTDYNVMGNAFSVDDGHQNNAAVLYDISGLKPVASFKNAMANQVLYSSFDNDNLFYITPYNFDKVSTGYNLVNGRIGQAVSLAPNFTFSKSAVNKGLGANYIFSCWINNPYPVAGSVAVTLTDGAHSSSGSIAYTNTTGIWTYYRIKIPVNNLNSVFGITVQTGAMPLILDDMLFYPELAQVTLTGYQNKLKIADTDPHGNTVFYAYDGLGRPTTVTDQSQNILKRTVYNYRSNYALNAIFTMPVTATTNTPISFLNGPIDPCESAGIVRNWNFGDGTTLANGGTSPTHTYTAPGNYTVALTVTHPQYGTVTTTQNITVSVQLSFVLHLNGIAAYNLCSQQVIITGDLPVTNALGTDTFTAAVTGSYTNQFLWQQAYDTTPNTWVTLPSTSNTLTISVPLNADGSVSSNKTYSLKCTMVPQSLENAAVTTTRIVFLAPGCNK